MPGTLYVVGTPIGNLEDITLRALRVLKEVDLIAAEDTRHTAKLLHHYGIATPLISCHEHNEAARASELVQRLLAGASVALVTDAGMPGISDPGALVIARAHEAGVPVVAVPGPSAAITALVLSGLQADRFVFEGFLPRAGKARQEALARLAQEPRAVVLYEAPHRLLATLADLETAVGDRPLAVCRELTKRYEEVRRGTAATLRAHFAAHPPQGEFTLVLGPAPLAGRGAAGQVLDGGMCRAPGEAGGPPEPADPAALAAAVRALETEGWDRKAALKEVARRYGCSRREVYQALLEQGGGGEEPT